MDLCAFFVSRIGVGVRGDIAEARHGYDWPFDRLRTEAVIAKHCRGRAINPQAGGKLAFRQNPYGAPRQPPTRRFAPTSPSGGEVNKPL